MGWPYLLPPLVLMLLTRTGIPVSTSFLILTFFKPKGLIDMTMKSILGYALAFCVAIIVWAISDAVARQTLHQQSHYGAGNQDLDRPAVGLDGLFMGAVAHSGFCNIYVYLPRALELYEIVASLLILLSMLAFIFYSKGGNIQKIVKAKTNTTDIRSATIIDFNYGIILLFFKEFSNVPMSTTWVFLGLLAGREIAIRYRLELDAEPSDRQNAKQAYYLGMVLNVVILILIGYVVYLRDAVDNLIIVVMAAAMVARAAVAYYETIPGRKNLLAAFRNIFSDLGKVAFGLAISIALVYLMRFLTTGTLIESVG